MTEKKEENNGYSTVLERFYTFPDPARKLVDVTKCKLSDYLDKFNPEKFEPVIGRQKYEQRLVKENQMLITNGFSEKILAWSALNDHLCEVGCVSGPGWVRFNCSLVAFLLGLGGVDPLRYGIECDAFLLSLRHGYPSFWFLPSWRSDINAALPDGLNMLVVDQENDTLRDTLESKHPWVERCLIVDEDLKDLHFSQVRNGMPAVPYDFSDQYGVVYWSAWFELHERIRKKDDGQSSLLWWGADIDVDIALRSLSEPESCDFLELESNGLLAEIITRLRPQKIGDLATVLFLQQRLSGGDCLKWLDGVEESGSHPLPQYLVEKFLKDSRGLLLFQDQFVGLVKYTTGWDFETVNEFRRVCCFKKYSDVFAGWRVRFLASVGSGMEIAEAEKLFDFLLQKADTIGLREPFLGQALLLCSIAKMRLQKQSK